MADESRTRNRSDNFERRPQGNPRSGGAGGGNRPGGRPPYAGRGPGGPGGNEGPAAGGGKRPRFQPRRRVCLYCANKNKVIDWKKFDELQRFVGGSGEILARRKSGLCAKHQRGVAVAVKRARHLALLSYTSEHLRVMGKG